MLLTIDPQSERPLFEQVASSVRQAIAEGRMRPGDRLPAAREIAAALGMNLHTVLHALQDLRDEGLIDLRRGRGAVVTASAASVADLRAEIQSLLAKASAQGLSADTLAALIRDAAAAASATPEPPAPFTLKEPIA